MYRQDGLLFPERGIFGVPDFQAFFSGAVEIAAQLLQTGKQPSGSQKKPVRQRDAPIREERQNFSYIGVCDCIAAQTGGVAEIALQLGIMWAGKPLRYVPEGIHKAFHSGTAGGVPGRQRFQRFQGKGHKRNGNRRVIPV